MSLAICGIFGLFMLIIVNNSRSAERRVIKTSKLFVSSYTLQKHESLDVPKDGQEYYSSLKEYCSAPPYV